MEVMLLSKYFEAGNGLRYGLVDIWKPLKQPCSLRSRGSKTVGPGMSTIRVVDGPASQNLPDDVLKSRVETRVSAYGDSEVRLLTTK